MPFMQVFTATALDFKALFYVNPQAAQLLIKHGHNAVNACINSV